METTINYEAKGVCLGKLWGGGEGAYTTEKYTNSSLSKLKTEIEKGIGNSTIDSGMGFESMIGALMIVTTIRTKTINGKNYTNKENENMFFGDLTEEQQDFLDNSYTDFLN